jgi:hypothetical protein
VRFYNKRGTAEQWIKEGKQAAHWTRLSCHQFRAKEVRLQLSVLAYTLGNLWRRLVLPARIEAWSLTSLQQRLVKTGGRLVKRARLLVDVRRESSDSAAVRGDAPVDLGAPGAGGLAVERWATTPGRSGIVSEQSLRAQWSVFQRRRGSLPEALTSEKCYRAMIVEVCNIGQPLKSGSATVPGRLATRRSQSWDSKTEIPG